MGVQEARGTLELLRKITGELDSKREPSYAPMSILPEGVPVAISIWGTGSLQPRLATYGTLPVPALASGHTLPLGNGGELEPRGDRTVSFGRNQRNRRSSRPETYGLDLNLCAPQRRYPDPIAILEPVWG